MSIPSAREMATSLRRCVHTLFNNEILQQESLSVIESVCAQLNSSRRNKVWSYSVGQGAPILFKKTTDKNNDAIIPSISVERISVDDNHIPFPYIKWNIALEIHFEKDNAPCARWHFDFANKTQPGPATHLQYGGRFGGTQKFDFNLNVPRWHTPLMDLVLLSETVTANFFPKLWESVRDDPGWCECVHMSQQLCFGPYLKKISSTFNVSRKTILNEVWNDRWN